MKDYRVELTKGRVYHITAENKTQALKQLYKHISNSDEASILWLYEDEAEFIKLTSRFTIEEK
jgi:hypothetical protein